MQAKEILFQLGLFKCEQLKILKVWFILRLSF